MSIQTKVAAALALAAVSNGDGTFRRYPNTLPQLPTYPAIAFQFISNLPADSLTQLARFSDFRVQVTAHALTYADIVSLRSAILTAMEAMPEYVTRDTDIEGPYEFEPKAFNWILGFHLRDAES